VERPAGTGKEGVEMIHKQRIFVCLKNKSMLEVGKGSANQLAKDGESYSFCGWWFLASGRASAPS
jgi:hypothetical protein